MFSNVGFNIFQRIPSAPSEIVSFAESTLTAVTFEYSFVVCAIVAVARKAV